LAVVGEILAGYGNPDASGNQGTDLSYANPRVDGNMSNTNACALSAAMSTIADSYNYSSVSDSNSTAAVTAINSACTSAGYTCSNITRDRSSCTGLAADAPSLVAVAIVASVNSAW